MRGFGCFRVRASLVDLAEGRLAEEARGAVERHVADCDGCAADVVALREVPAVLRQTAAQEREEYWVRQRARIMAAIELSKCPHRKVVRSSPTIPISTQRPHLPDSRRASLAALAACLAAIVVVGEWRIRSSDTFVAERATAEDSAAEAPVELSADESAEDGDGLVALTDDAVADELGDLFEDATI